MIFQLTTQTRSVAILLLAICLFISQSTFASDIFHEANKAYAAGDLDKALKLYEETKEEQGWSSGLLFNLGNTYHQLGLYGQSVLNYKRALYLDPSNHDALANLKFTLKETGIFLDERSKVMSLLMMLSINRWAYVAIASFTILAASFFVWGALPLLRLKIGIVSEETKRPIKFLLSAVASIFILSCIAILSHLPLMKEAVVISKDGDVLVSPFDEASKVFTLKPAKIVQINKEFQNYYLIKDDSGQSGWIKKDKIERVIPK